MKLISDRMEKELTNLYGLCFIGNSICDNFVTQLAVKFVMPNTSNIVHYNMAHVYPELADFIGEYAQDRNSWLHRPLVPAHTEDYSGLKPMFDILLQYMIDFEKQVGYVMDIAISEDDKQTLKNLDKFLRKLKVLTKMCLDFCDYIEANGDTPKDHMDMDARINKFMDIKRI